MALTVIRCGGEGCDRNLYVQVEVGEQTVYCYGCGSANLITFREGDVDEEE